jgi:putative AlgH/UPF0301 family transcriptional regulator
MTKKKKYAGQLLIANPGNQGDELSRSVLLLVTHTESIAIALQINLPHQEALLSDISHGMGIPYSGNDPLYYGGNISVNKIHVVHSLDWRGVGTVPLTKELGITQDISILTAISQNQGPYYFKACTGYWLWEEGRLDEMLDPRNSQPREPYKWEVLPANLETVFEIEPEEMWETCLERAARYKIDTWL